MWYDLIVLAILGYFALRGAARGLLTQLASIAAIVVCLVFAESISAAFGPIVNLEPPLNNWVVMLGAYLVFTFLAFGFARVLTDWVERAKLDSFNQHLGAVFGLVKGVVLCLVLTYFLVTLSPASRAALSKSKSAYAAAYIMDRIHPVMPQNLEHALAKYLRAYETGVPESEEPGEGELPSGPLLTGPGPGAPPAAGVPTWPTNNDPFGPPMIHQQGGGGGRLPSASPSNTAPPVNAATQQAIDQFLSQLPATIGNDLRYLLGESLAHTPPEQWGTAQQQFWNMLRQTRPEDLRDLQNQLLSDRQQSLGTAIARWMGSFVAPGSSSGAAPSQPGTGSPTYPQAGGSPAQPGYNGYPNWPGSPSTPPAPAQPTSPPPLTGGPSTQQDQLLEEISRAYSSIPPVQLQVKNDIRQRLAGLPPEVVQTVLEDWRRDLWRPQAVDPDPGTDANATLEARIVRQLQRRGIPLNRLSSEVQHRLEGAALR